MATKDHGSSISTNYASTVRIVRGKPSALLYFSPRDTVRQVGLSVLMGSKRDEDFLVDYVAEPDMVRRLRLRLPVKCASRWKGIVRSAVLSFTSETAPEVWAEGLPRADGPLSAGRLGLKSSAGKISSGCISELNDFLFSTRRKKQGNASSASSLHRRRAQTFIRHEGA